MLAFCIVCTVAVAALGWGTLAARRRAVRLERVVYGLMQERDVAERRFALVRHGQQALEAGLERLDRRQSDTEGAVQLLVRFSGEFRAAKARVLAEIRRLDEELDARKPQG